MPPRGPWRGIRLAIVEVVVVVVVVTVVVVVVVVVIVGRTDGRTGRTDGEAVYLAREVVCWVRQRDIESSKHSLISIRFMITILFCRKLPARFDETLRFR